MKRYESDEFDLNEGDVITSIVDGMPNIYFSERVHTLVQRSMSKLVIIKMLGRKIKFNTLCSKLHAICRPTCTFQLMDLNNDYYIVKFQTKEDYEKALTKGPWVIYGQSLTMQPWSLLFSTQEEYSMQVVVWIRLPCFPSAWYKRRLPEAVGNLIGQVVRVDDNTENGY
ncbi:hypothetical protein J1N35_007187 [Gossypium stocksii]|uniref:DUF4283 domain-containing protein n=1 Tax=Gossypium stocksii TaxID=47602 RepID=A0A9D3W604_9ROSI|nr:hypothetical protein J1N35_007187 [Gossypium stocksii]